MNCTQVSQIVFLARGDFPPLGVLDKARSGRRGHLRECHITTE